MKKDPRIVRTKKLLINSFLEVSKVKEFKNITIKDITDLATVNRATFYAHFVDKYDLLEEVLSETLLKELNEEFLQNEELNEKKAIKLFLLISSHYKEIENQCLPKTRTYDDFFEERIKKKLEILFLSALKQNHPESELRELQLTAIFISWGLYGLITDWRKMASMNPEAYIVDALPFIKKLFDNK